MTTFINLRDDEIEAIKGYTKYINANPTNPHTPMMKTIRAQEEAHLGILNNIISGRTSTPAPMTWGNRLKAGLSKTMGSIQSSGTALVKNSPKDEDILKGVMD